MSLMPFGPLPRCGRLLYHADGLSHSCPACPDDFNVTVAPPPTTLHILLIHHQFSWCAYTLVLSSFSPSFLTWLYQLASPKQLNINVCVTEDLKGKGREGAEGREGKEKELGL